MIDDRVFIQNIRNIMRIKNITISELSKIVGHNMHPILNEKQKISMNCVRDCADKLKMNIWELFFPNPEQFPSLLEGKDNHDFKFQLELSKRDNQELHKQLNHYVQKEADKLVLYKQEQGFVIQKNGVTIPVSVPDIEIKNNQIYAYVGLVIDELYGGDR